MSVSKNCKKYLLFLLIILSASLTACRKGNLERTICSPDGRLSMRVFLEEGKAYYDITCDGNDLLKRSAIGFEFKDRAAFGENLEMGEYSTDEVDETWVPVCGTDDSIRNCYHEMRVALMERVAPKRKVTLVARAYNDGIAFRYLFPEDFDNDSLKITAEKTEFRFASNDSAWWIPADEFAYESLYRHTPLSEIPDANTPMTFENKDGLWISIHEAALLDYSEMTLRRTEGEDPSFVSSLWPEPDSVCARVALPFRTPWRVVMIARDAGGLITSHLIQNLNEPCAIQDVSWIQPMKFIGIWWGMHIKRYTWSAGPDHGATTARAKEYIDFAAAHGIGGVLAEGWNKGWETWASGQVPLQDFCTAYPDFDLEEVVRYAKEKNVIFISHHETGGNIPEYERQLESALALCRSHGITALKTGYAGPILPKGYHHHGQYMVRHFQKVVELAAKYHIMLDVHESIKPTGLDRTWPNLMTQEGARGNEWNATYKATPPYHATILPFTRFLAGPYDYTPGIFKIVHSPESNKRLYCTRTYQLAMFVVYYSPLMMVSDMIENYEGQAGLRFIEEVPCNWDETRVPAAHPGDYVCIARREKDRWFVGTITDEQCRLIKIPMSFLKSGQRYLATIYGDSISTDWENLPEAMEIGHYVVTADDTICAALSKAGGNAVMITPLGNDRLKDYLAISTYNREAENKMKVFRTRKTYGDLHIEHLALKKPLKLKESYSERYPASGKQALTDGERGSYNFSAGGWQGFEGCDMEATIDLQELKKIHSITAGFLSSVNDWIFFPTTVTFYYSKNGSDYIKAGEKYLSNNKRDEKTVSIKDLSVQFDEVSARYVKVAAKSIGTCPSWHYGKGGKAWLFCDEIMVN